jgi:hypothetical protein
VNLALADVQKESSHFDLPIALGLLAEMDILPQHEIGGYLAVGELALDGSLTSVAGVLLAALAASGREGMFDMLTLFDLSAVIGRVNEPDAQREAEIEGAIAGETAEVDRLYDSIADGRESHGAKRAIDRREAEIAGLQTELEAHRRQARIADATRDRDQVVEFRKLIERMGEEMTDAERFLLRVRLSSEFKRLIEVITTDGKDLVVTMRTLPENDPVNIGRLWAGVGTLGPYTAGHLSDWGLFDIEKFRPPTYTEPPPIEEAWTPDELAEWRARA